MADKNFSSTIGQGIALLRCFSPTDPLLGNKELSERLALPTSTVARLTATLCELGLLARVDRHRKYKLGYGSLTLAYPVLANMRERYVARRLMKELTDATMGQTSMAVLSGLEAIYVESFRPDEQWLSRPEVGTTRPALHTAIGHALLYSLEAGRFQYLMNTAKAADAAGFKPVQRRIMDSFEQIAKVGYCTVHGTYRPELHAVGVPLTPRNDPDPIAFNLSLRVYGGKRPDLAAYAGKLVELRDRTLDEMGRQN